MCKFWTLRHYYYICNINIIIPVIFNNNKITVILLRKSTCLECMYCLLQLFIHWCIIILYLVAKLLFIIIALFISSSIVTKYLFILDALL